MKLYVLYVFRFGLIALTLLALVLQPWFPERRILLHPLPTTSVAIDGHYDPEYGETNVWLNRDRAQWRCDYKPAYGYGKTCGFSISWGETFSEARKNILTTPLCVNAMADEDGDGWGWENNASCIVAQAQEQRLNEPSNASVPLCANADSDDDGDGWGWENQKSCRVAAQAQTAPQQAFPDCLRTDSDEDGDGWGWESGRSCIVPAASAPAESEKPEDANNFKQHFPLCQFSDSDPDGDGWGWENEQSCLMPPNNATRRNIATADFSAYDYLKIHIHYEGRANALRVYLRNFNPAYATAGDPDSTKFMSVPIRTEDLKSGPVKVNLSEFKVAEWWINERDAPRRWLGAEYDNLTVLGIDIAEFGVHHVRVQSIELLGEWLNLEQTLMILLLLWLLYLLFEGFYRFIYLRNETRVDATKVDELLEKTEALNKEKARLINLSNRDSLTQILNRQGFFEVFEAEYASPARSNNRYKDLSHLGLLLLDLDHFKKVNDRFGHKVGDDILKAFSQLVEEDLNPKDIFCRWGGEEFIVLVGHTLGYKLKNKAEKIRKKIEAHKFVWLDDRLTVSIGVTMFYASDKFESAYRRADAALYKAKVTRNKVVYEI